LPPPQPRAILRADNVEEQMPDASPRTIVDLVARAHGPAIGAPGTDHITYGELAAQINRTGAQLAGAGVGRGDGVAIVLPNGPHMATAFLGIAAHATAAPLNPAYREEEFAFYLEDLEARLLIVAEGVETPARAAAARLGIPLAELRRQSEAGGFTLIGADGTPLPEAEATPNGPEDEALVLHTSGTTSRPKIVPLTSRNICASAENIARTLKLAPGDRCLNIMPLFHIHGLIAAVLASVQAGAAISCTPGFDALRFYGWLKETDPTWYTAVPTMHQAILARAPRNAEIIRGARLRFIRSSSASLPVPVFNALEETFGCPVIEAYGMTEAAHQMCSNLLPPGKRKPGTVGVAQGPEVELMDEEGNILPRGAVGEVVIRGENVTKGYRNNPKANAESFVNGWFRTGDQGQFDEEGFLTIRGRLKEIINRGGEKISPREVDDVLMEHPAIAQVVTFAIPHRMLGEDVAAAVVLAEGATATPAEIRAFAAERLAAFKVPAKVLILDEIPKGATGKLQRIGLAEKLGLAEPEAAQ
jgi:acyl-CoA synthetase (AMP-forming)/AMP-acid ligase II